MKSKQEEDEHAADNPIDRERVKNQGNPKEAAAKAAQAEKNRQAAVSIADRERVKTREQWRAEQERGMKKFEEVYKSMKWSARVHDFKRTLLFANDNAPKGFKRKVFTDDKILLGDLVLNEYELNRSKGKRFPNSRPIAKDFKDQYPHNDPTQDHDEIYYLEEGRTALGKKWHSYLRAHQRRKPYKVQRALGQGIEHERLALYGVSIEFSPDPPEAVAKRVAHEKKWRKG